MNCITIQEVSPHFPHSKQPKKYADAIRAKQPNPFNDKNNRGFAPIHLAVKNGMASVVKSMLEKNADVNQAGPNGRTPLDLAAEQGHKNVVELLLKRGANIDSRDIEGKTPLYTATVKGHGPIINMLLSAKADVNLSHNDTQTTPLMIAIMNATGKTNERLTNIYRLLETTEVDINKANSCGNTALSWAIDLDIKPIAITLLERGADVTNISSLSNPAYFGHETIVEMLINRRIDLEKTMDDNTPPLYIAAEEGHTAVVAKLLDYGANVNKVCNGKTPLYIAAEKRHAEVVSALLAARANKNKPYDGKSPLYIAAESGHDTVVNLLMNAGAIKNKVCNGKTPLQIAKEKGHTEVSKLLDNSGANVKVTTLSLEAQNGEQEIALLEQGGLSVALKQDTDLQIKYKQLKGQIVQFSMHRDRNKKKDYNQVRVRDQNRNFNSVIDCLNLFSSDEYNVFVEKLLKDEQIKQVLNSAKTMLDNLIYTTALPEGRFELFKTAVSEMITQIERSYPKEEALNWIKQIETVTKSVVRYSTQETCDEDKKNTVRSELIDLNNTMSEKLAKLGVFREIVKEKLGDLIGVLDKLKEDFAFPKLLSNIRNHLDTIQGNEPEPEQVLAPEPAAEVASKEERLLIEIAKYDSSEQRKDSGVSFTEQLGSLYKLRRDISSYLEKLRSAGSKNKPMQNFLFRSVNDLTELQTLAASEQAAEQLLEDDKTELERRSHQEVLALVRQQDREFASKERVARREALRKSAEIAAEPEPEPEPELASETSSVLDDSDYTVKIEGDFKEAFIAYFKLLREHFIETSSASTNDDVSSFKEELQKTQETFMNLPQTYFDSHKRQYETNNEISNKLSEQEWMTLLQNHCETVLEKMSSQKEIKDIPLINALHTLLNLLNTYSQDQSITELTNPGEVEVDDHLYKTCQVDVPGYGLQTFVIESTHFKQCIEKDVPDLRRVSLTANGVKLEDKEIFHWKVSKAGRVFAMPIKKGEWIIRYTPYHDITDEIATALMEDKANFCR